MAGLIPQSFIDDLLSRVDIVDVIDKRVRLRKTGKNYAALCPFHQEKSPSFSVEPDKQFYYCFGCGAGGNAIGFVMDYDKVDFPRAVESLAADCGMQIPREQSETARKQHSKHQQLLEILEQANRYYQQQLRQHPARQRAIDYLKQRGLSGDIAARYNMGLAPPGWDNLLNTLTAAGHSPELLVQAGLLIERDGDSQSEQRHRHYDRFRDRIIFPIRNSRGQVIAFGGRVLGDDKPKYLNSPETPVYHKGRELYGLYEARRAERQLQRILVVEGYMDVVALAQHGITNAVATLGTATSETHLQQLFRLVSEIVFCFDGDEAGRRAAQRAMQTALPLMQDGRQLRFLFLPEGDDPDSMVRREGEQAFRQRLLQASPLSDFLFDQLTHSLDLQLIDDRARLASEALPLLRQLPDNIYRQLLLDRLAELTATDSERLQQMLEQGSKSARSQAQTESTGARHASEGPVPPAPPRAHSANPAAARPREPARINKPASLIAIELLLYRPALARELTQDLAPLRTLNDAHCQLLIELVEFAQNNPTTNTYTLLGLCYGTRMGSQLTQLLNSESITPEVGVEDEFRYVINSMLQQAEKQRFRQQLIERHKPRLRSGNNEGS